MTDQKPGVDHAQVQAELNIALLCGSNNVIEDCTETEETLFVTCISGDSHKLQELLNDKLFLATAIERKSQRFGAMRREISNLLPMLSMAIRAGHAKTTRFLLATAEKHKVPYQDLVNFNTVCDAIDCGNLDVLKELALAFPACLGYGENRIGYPLDEVVGRSRFNRNGKTLWSEQKEFEYLKVMLENGADPNGPGPTRDPFYLSAAAQYSPVDITKLLIHYGAKVPQSGALQTAVEANRVEILEVLLEHGADVNERLVEIWDMMIDADEEVQHLSETPLHYGVRAKAYEATAWLLQHGADKSIHDARNKSPADYAAESDDARMVEIFRS
jgi:ankyrin repeat protein